MQLPAQLEKLRERKIWVCYPMIYNPSKHNGVGGFDKPPINPYTLRNGSTDKADSLATFDEAAAQIGKKASVKVNGRDGFVECDVMGVGIALGGSGICGVDLDNVVDYREGEYKITVEAGEIISALSTYTEISPSYTGIHILFEGELPEGIKKIAKPKRDIMGGNKAEYQLFDSGYLTVSGYCKSYPIAQRTQELAQVYERFFAEIPAISTLSTSRPEGSGSSVVSCDDAALAAWLTNIYQLSDAEILDGIVKSPKYGEGVRTLYNGDTSAYGGDHSRADQALVSLLYCFTGDREITERLFRCSALYRATGKSRNYLERTLNKAEKNAKLLAGHITWTYEARRAYAQAKEAQERAAQINARKNKQPF